jgi:hypothetical protein
VRDVRSVSNTLIHRLIDQPVQNFDLQTDCQRYRLDMVRLLGLAHGLDAMLPCHFLFRRLHGDFRHVLHQSHHSLLLLLHGREPLHRHCCRH